MGFLRSYSNSVREAKDRSILFSTYSGYFFKSETARPLGGKKKKKKSAFCTCGCTVDSLGKGLLCA